MHFAFNSNATAEGLPHHFGLFAKAWDTTGLNHSRILPQPRRGQRIKPRASALGKLRMTDSTPRTGDYYLQSQPLP